MSHNTNSWRPSINIKDVFFNVKNKVYLWFLNQFVAKEDEYYGLTEPSGQWMNLNNKKFWIQPYNESNEEEKK